MRRRSETDGGTRRRASRSAGALPLVAAITSALALTGAAFYTVDRAACGDPAQYIRHDNHIELVGGCVEGTELQQLRTTQSHSSGQVATENNYRP
ncbi:hypothetical protein FHX82_001671 [Amycolatopsis bartoniae]|uniref:Uncharacterized protein n=1 Tax=Amycolatopsis bartoniae TaxID=941986 RepID=A0A8H9IQL6_9PSEU|nr:hypothetical protein [Amycolatopsis bartoniae]MBB2934651.1 hypothetical protein [Amycolatopsis bartoniae]TVT09313.1 hypothetical protein FNH07_09105 [Amycolatopsis bartoniae]GHF45815.1 hypothetical protein GCM10017566_18580 [Amycolatopsis bartoniae]